MSGLPVPGPEWLQHYGTGAVFAACTLESVLVPIPTPPFVMMAGAYLIPQGIPWKQVFLPILTRVAVPGAAGTTAGSLVIFYLCYWGGKPAIDRYGKYFGIQWEGVLKINTRLEKQVEAAVFVTRALPLFPISVVSAAAGVMRLSVWEYMLWTFLGSLLRYQLLGYAGWLGRGGFEASSHLGHLWWWAGAAGGLLVIVGLVWWKKLRQRTA